MGFLETEIAEDGEDFLLVEDLWKLLEGDSNKGVTAQNLLQMLFIIRGVNVQSNFIMSKHLKTLAFLGLASVDEKNGELKVTEKGKNKLFVHFKSLFVNRIKFEGLN